jgi:hypothetical protein
VVPASGANLSAAHGEDAPRGRSNRLGNRDGRAAALLQPTRPGALPPRRRGTGTGDLPHTNHPPGPLPRAERGIVKKHAGALRWGTGGRAA